MLNYDDYVIIKITKVKDDSGRFSHWESETRFNDNYYGSEITGPDFYTVSDEAFEYIRDIAQYWTVNDSNERKI